MIKHQEDKYNWEFMFIGANMDTAQEANQLGINKEAAYQFEATEIGMKNMYSMVNEEISERRNRMK